MAHIIWRPVKKNLMDRLGDSIVGHHAFLKIQIDAKRMQDVHVTHSFQARSFPVIP
jgi:hypothetical protein